MELFYKLDTVLSTLNKIYHSDRTNENVVSIKRVPIEVVVEFTKNEYQLELTNIDMELVLEKLIEDRYVKRVQQTNPVALLYYITYVGSVFIENGGYDSQNENDQRQNRIAVRNELLLILGSCGAAIAGFGVVVIELLKHYVWQSKP